MESVASTLSLDDSKLLLGHCRAGRLYEIEAWVASGNSLRTPPEARTTPLQAVIETGFQSLIELLIRHAPGAEELRKGLAAAVLKRRVDLVRLLLARGADIHSVPLVDVLLSWQPTVIRCFLENGADPIAGAPFAIAFAEKVRTALRPFVEYRAAHPEMKAELQEQADRALRHFADQGNLKWVSLMLWAGGDPRSLGPTALEKNPEDADCFTSAIDEACYSGSLEVFKRLKPDPSRDDLSLLLSKAALLHRRSLIVYLLDLGADPNDKQNGGSSAIDRCLLNLGSPDFNALRYNLPRSRYSASEILECLETLASCGGIWRPNDRREMNWVRLALYKCEPDVTLDVLRSLLKHQSCPIETVRELLAPPRMKEHLDKRDWHLARLGLRDLWRTKSKVAGPPVIPRWLRSRYDREKLFEEVWEQPMLKVAMKYGVSDVALAKTCRTLHVPVPGRGYWAKRAAGKAVGTRPVLPSVEFGR